MPPPIADGQVSYDDGSPETLEQYSKDIATFLMWAAEPHMEARKRLGLQVMLFLIILSGLLYFTKRKVWSMIGLYSTTGPGWANMGRSLVRLRARVS